MMFIMNTSYTMLEEALNNTVWLQAESLSERFVRTNLLLSMTPTNAELRNQTIKERGYRSSNHRFRGGLSTVLLFKAPSIG
jgi:hypothetical protein